MPHLALQALLLLVPEPALVILQLSISVLPTVSVTAVATVKNAIISHPPFLL